MSGSDERISGESRSIVVLPAALVSSAAMAGVIAAVQLIIYPSFLDIPGDPFAVYHQWYSQRITWIVGPVAPSSFSTGKTLGWPKRCASAICDSSSRLDHGKNKTSFSSNA